VDIVYQSSHLIGV